MIEFTTSLYLGNEWQMWEEQWQTWMSEGGNSEDAPEPPEPIKSRILIDPSYIVAVYEKFSALQSIVSVKKSRMPKLDELTIVTTEADFTVQCSIKEYQEKINAWKESCA